MRKESVLGLSEKDDVKIDGTMKAIIVGGAYFMNRRITKTVKRNHVILPTRYLLLWNSFNAALRKRKMNHVDKGVCQNLMNSVVWMAAMDNAYGTFLDDTIREYVERMKKGGLPL
jgi:hypothetical protein